jgi:hypothetical protein
MSHFYYSGFHYRAHTQSTHDVDDYIVGFKGTATDLVSNNKAFVQRSLYIKFGFYNRFYNTFKKHYKLIPAPFNFNHTFCSSQPGITFSTARQKAALWLGFSIWASS